MEMEKVYELHMLKRTQEKMMEAIKAANELYFSLVLLLGPANINRKEVVNKVAEELGYNTINLNLELSKRLLEMTHKKRALKITEKLDEVVAPFHEYAILDFTEILFDVSLKQYPLALLKRMSRNRTIVASWSGTVENGKLTYAEPGHPEYRVYDTSDIQIVNIETAL